MSYQRVVPRDLFNESMLLKCLGRLSVDILDGKFHKYGMQDGLIDPELGFRIAQNDSGDIFCENYHVYTKFGQLGLVKLELFSPLNSRINYPLICESAIDGNLIDVFKETGTYTPSFKKYLNELLNFKE